MNIVAEGDVGGHPLSPTCVELVRGGGRLAVGRRRGAEEAGRGRGGGWR